MKNQQQFNKDSYMPFGLRSTLNFGVQITDLLHYWSNPLSVMVLQPEDGAIVSYLSRYFQQVIGCETNYSNLKKLKEKWEATPTKFAHLDLTDTSQISQWAAETGDTHVFLTGSLQQIPLAKRKQFTGSIIQLLGTQGVFYYIELPQITASYLNSISREIGILQGQVKEIVLRKVTSLVGINAEDIQAFFPEKQFDMLLADRIEIEIALNKNESVQVFAERRIMRVKCNTSSH